MTEPFRPKAGMRWQSIDTAPQDGTHILAGIAGAPRSAGEMYWWEGRWLTWDGENHRRTVAYPDCWQPMPDAPDLIAEAKPDEVADSDGFQSLVETYDSTIARLEADGIKLREEVRDGLRTLTSLRATVKELQSVLADCAREFKVILSDVMLRRVEAALAKSKATTP